MPVQVIPSSLTGSPAPFLSLQKNNGRNFIVFLENPLSPQLCHGEGPMSNAIYLIIEWPYRWCGRTARHPADTLVVPYVASVIPVE